VNFASYYKYRSVRDSSRGFCTFPQYFSMILIDIKKLGSFFLAKTLFQSYESFIANKDMISELLGPFILWLNFLGCRDIRDLH